jgi:hypothetical protein
MCGMHARRSVSRAAHTKVGDPNDTFDRAATEVGTCEAEASHGLPPPVAVRVPYPGAGYSRWAEAV